MITEEAKKYAESLGIGRWQFHNVDYYHDTVNTIWGLKKKLDEKVQERVEAMNHASMHEKDATEKQTKINELRASILEESFHFDSFIQERRRIADSQESAGFYAIVSKFGMKMFAILKAL